MEDEIQKLISEYYKKISDVEIQLSNISSEIQRERRSKEDYTSLKIEQARMLTKLNLYHQARADFDSLLDFTGE